MPSDAELATWMHRSTAPDGSVVRTAFQYSPHVGANRTWTEAKDREYRHKGAVAVSIAAPTDVSFAADLPGLLSFRVLMHPLKDDTPVFGATRLQQLHLLDRCRRAFRADCLPDLVDLVVDQRPGLDTLRDHANLRALTVYGFNLHDLEWLGAPPHLLALNLVGTRRPLRLDGGRCFRSLEVLMLQRFQVEDLAALAQAVGLQQLLLEGTDAEVLDLADLPHLPNLRSLTVQRTAGLRNLEALLTLPRLEAVNFWRSPIVGAGADDATLAGHLRRNMSRNLNGVEATERKPG